MPMPRSWDDVYQWRVTRYDPAFRLPDGTWGRAAREWSVVQHIGRTIGGVRLTRRRYLAVEDRYCAAARLLFRACGVGAYRVRGLEPPNPRRSGGRMGHRLLWRPGRSSPLREGKQFRGRQAERLLEEACRLALRDIAWVRLECAGRFFLHFGDDFYLYAGTPEVPRAALRRIAAMKLFVEPFFSPYLEANAAA